MTKLFGFLNVKTWIVIVAFIALLVGLIFANYAILMTRGWGAIDYVGMQLLSALTFYGAALLAPKAIEKIREV